MNQIVFKNPMGKVQKVDGCKTVYETVSLPKPAWMGCHEWRTGSVVTKRTRYGVSKKDLVDKLMLQWLKEQEWEPKKGQQLELFPHPMDNPDNNPFLAKIANRFNCPC